MKNCCKIAGRNEQTPVTGVGGIDVTNIHPVLSTLPEPDQAITFNVKIYFKDYAYYVNNYVYIIIISIIVSCILTPQLDLYNSPSWTRDAG